MKLTRRALDRYLWHSHVRLPKEVEEDLLKEFNGQAVIDTEGRPWYYSEQDIWENVRKTVQRYEELQRESNRQPLWSNDRVK